MKTVRALVKKIKTVFKAKKVQVYSTHLPKEYFEAKRKLSGARIKSSTYCVTGGRNAHILQYNVYVNEDDVVEATKVLEGLIEGH